MTKITHKSTHLNQRIRLKTVFDVHECLISIAVYCYHLENITSIFQFVGFYSDFLKIYSSSGSKILISQRGYSRKRQVLVEVHFGAGNYITLHANLYGRYSRFMVTYAIVRRSLQSGMVLLRDWYIRTFHTNFYVLISLYELTLSVCSPLQCINMVVF